MWLLLGFRPLYSRMITVNSPVAQAHRYANVNGRSYYLSPAQPTQQPQPIIYDPVLDLSFPYELTDPDNIPNIIRMRSTSLCREPICLPKRGIS